MNQKLLVGTAIAVLLCVAAALAPWLSAHDPNRQDLGAIRRPPVWHPGGLTGAYTKDASYIHIGRDKGVPHAYQHRDRR